MESSAGNSNTQVNRTGRDIFNLVLCLIVYFEMVLNEKREKKKGRTK